MTLHADDPEKLRPQDDIKFVFEKALKLAKSLKRDDAIKAQADLEDLNLDALKLGLTGRMMKLETDQATWAEELLDLETATVIEKPITSPEDGNEHQGVIRGFDLITFDGTTELVYKIETEKAFDGLSSIIATSPVEGTRVIVLFTPNEMGSFVDPSLYDSVFERIFNYRNGGLTEDMESFVEVWGATERIIDSDIVSELGILATHLLSYEELQKDEQARQTILSMLYIMTRKTDPFEKIPYYILGHFMEPFDTPDGTRSSISHGEGIYEIVGTTLVKDYDPLPDGGVQTSELSQVAFTVRGEDGEYLVPLRFIQDFYEMKDDQANAISACGKFGHRVMQSIKQEQEHGVVANEK